MITPVFIPPIPTDDFKQDIDTGIANASEASSANRVSADWEYGQYGSSESKDANEGYLKLYKSTGDREYLEKYLDNILARQSVNDARAFQKLQDDTVYSRAFDDIKKAGYNPWLLLQGSAATAGSNNVAAASYSKNNAFESIANRQNQKDIADSNNRTKVIVGIIAAAALIAKMLI